MVGFENGAVRLGKIESGFIFRVAMLPAFASKRGVEVSRFEGADRQQSVQRSKCESARQGY